jgi:predicted RNA-binding Zn-ribbon protein involved in translation (DUF1610 family)
MSLPLSSSSSSSTGSKQTFNLCSLCGIPFDTSEENAYYCPECGAAVCSTCILELVEIRPVEVFHDTAKQGIPEYASGIFKGLFHAEYACSHGIADGDFLGPKSLRIPIERARLLETFWQSGRNCAPATCYLKDEEKNIDYTKYSEYVVVLTKRRDALYIHRPLDFEIKRET